MPEEERGHVLRGFVQGTMPRSVAMRKLGITWYGDLLDDVAAAGLRRQPAPEESQREAKKFAHDLLNRAMREGTTIRIAIPDTGPLVSLARADALEVLLTFNDSVRILITEYVSFEVTPKQNQHTDGRKIADFFMKHPRLIETQETPLGALYKRDAKLRELVRTDPTVASTFSDISMAEPDSLAEMSIVEYTCRMIAEPSGESIIVLAEDEFLLREDAKISNNGYILSTHSFLSELAKLGQIPSSESIWERIGQAHPIESLYPK